MGSRLQVAWQKQYVDLGLMHRVTFSDFLQADEVIHRPLLTRCCEFQSPRTRPLRVGLVFLTRPLRVGHVFLTRSLRVGHDFLTRALKVGQGCL